MKFYFILAKSCSESIVRAHLKCPLGQALYPCNPQGRQSRATFVSTINDLSDKGPKPKAGMVEQKTAVTGALTADAMCIGAESFE